MGSRFSSLRGGDRLLFSPFVSFRGLLAPFGFDLPRPEAGAPGDAGLFGPASMVWRIGRERLLLAGAQAALLLQLAHPLVAAGVSDHSGFRGDPFGRLRATLDATLRITFGDRAQAEAAIAGVRRVHERVRGRLGTDVGRYRRGAHYDAKDPHLALWVHATLVVTALEVYARFVRPLSFEERDCYLREGKPLAAMFGVTEKIMPDTYGDFVRYVEGVVDGGALAVGDEARSLARTILHPPMPAALRPAAALLREVTAELLPPFLCVDFGLAGGGSRYGVAARMAAGPVARAVALAPSAIRYWPHYRAARARLGSGGSLEPVGSDR